MVRLVADKELRTRLRERGLQHAAQWTWERTAQQTLAVLEAAAHA
jgi:glycosyltransferase involved in cell wall biosynthesis